MTSRITARTTSPGPLVPSMGTLPAAANQFFPKETLVTQDESGNAVSPSTADVSGLPAVGVSSASYDNRTNSPEGGLAGSLDVQLKFGVFGFDFTGTTPKMRDKLFVVDNQTVSVDSLNGTRGFAGICSEVRTENGVAQAFFWINPLSSLAGSLQGFTPIPLTSFVDDDGDPLAKFVNGASAVPGFNLTDSEALTIRWNNNATLNAILTSLALPSDVDASQPMSLEMIVSKSGATVGDATTMLVAAYLLSIGDLDDADTNAGGTSGALTPAAPAKTTQLLTVPISAANNPTGVRMMTLTIKPTDGTLGTDDLSLLAVGLRYSRK